MNYPSRGVVIGRFMPPHRGHQYLFDFASDYADTLSIFVCTLPDEPIPGDLRYQWVRSMNPGAHVVHITEQIAAAERDRPNSYAIWAQTMEKHLDGPVDFVFASESYGWKLAEALSARFVSVDTARHVFPISGTQIRENPYTHWRFIPAVVRPYYLRKIAVLESRRTGEGVFARTLADRLDTVVVQDYLSYWESLGVSMSREEDLRHVLSAQHASERALEAHANGILVLAGESIGLATEWRERGRELPSWYDEQSFTESDHYFLVGLADDARTQAISMLKARGLPYTEFVRADEAKYAEAVELAQGCLAVPPRRRA